MTAKRSWKAAQQRRQRCVGLELTLQLGGPGVCVCLTSEVNDHGVHKALSLNCPSDRLPIRNPYK